MAESSNEISMSEVRKHNTESSAWIVVDNHVYDVTKYMDEHPGGADVLLEAAGTDATREFKDVGHSDDAREIMQKYKMGKVQHSNDRHEQCDSCVCLGAPWRTYDRAPPAPAQKPTLYIYKPPKTHHRSGHKTYRSVSAGTCAREDAAAAPRVSFTRFCDDEPDNRGKYTAIALSVLAAAVIAGFIARRVMA